MDSTWKIRYKTLKAYACYNRNEEIRMDSSSGGVFSALAMYCLRHGGVVYGVAISDDCYSAEFVSVTDPAGLCRLRGSKYLQAKAGDVHRQVKDDLESGKMVLFSGTGCQVNGLKGFLGKEYGSLLCVDVICHGVPSPALWKKYAQYQEQKNGGKLKRVDFRCKEDGWVGFGMKVDMEGGSGGMGKSIYSSKDEDPYMQMFLRDVCLRPSCYSCRAKRTRRSDLTIADFWGVDQVAPEMNDNKGTSLVLVRTEFGEKFLGEISEELRLKEVAYEDGVRHNLAECQSAAKPAQRAAFFPDMRNMSFEELEKKYAAPAKTAILKKWKRKLKKILSYILKNSENLPGGKAVR